MSMLKQIYEAKREITPGRVETQHTSRSRKGKDDIKRDLTTPRRRAETGILPNISRKGVSSPVNSNMQIYTEKYSSKTRSKKGRKDGK